MHCRGGEVSLKPDVTGHPDGILWKHKGNKVVEFNGNEQQVYKPFENRITVDWVSAAIQITDLRFEDSGEYELELEFNKKWHSFFYQLEVIDKIAKPTISCEINDDSIGNISGKLLCSAEPGRLQTVKKLEWRSHGSVQPGPEFNIPLGGEHNEEEYSCTVSNPRSSGTATFTAKDCYPVKSSSVGLTAGLVSVCILLLVAVLGIVWFCKLRHKACFAKDDPEKQSPVVPKKGKDEKKAERSERKYGIPNRESTLRSNQPLRNLNQAISGEDKKKADRSEEERLLHHSDTTLPSNQSLHFNQDHNIDDQEADTPQKGGTKELIRYHEQNNSGHIYGSQRGSKKTACPRSPQPAFSQDQNNLGDEDADREHLEEKIQLGKATNSEEAEPNPAGVSDVPSEETQSDLEPSVPEQTEKNSVSPPSPTHSGSASSPDLNNLGDEDADQNRENLEREIPQGKLTDSEKAGPDPADLSDVLSEESSVPEQTEKNTEEHEKTASPPSPRHNESPSLGQSNVGAEDADQRRKLAEGETPQVHNSDSEKENLDTAGVMDVPSEETQSDLESSIVPEQPEKNTDQHEKTASPPSPTHSGSASSLDQSNVEDEDADQHKGLADDKIPQCDPSDSEKADPESADVSDVPSEESRSDMESSVTEHTGNTTDEHEKTMSPPFPQNNLEAEDADQHREFADEETPQVDNSDSEKEDPDPAVVTDVSSEETLSDLESSVPEHTGLETTTFELDSDNHREPEKKDDKAEEMQSAPANAETCSPAQPPEDSTFGHKETNEKNVRESDSSGEEERNESDDSTEDEHSPTLPEHKGLETTHEQDLKAAEEETHSSQDKKQEVSETVKPVSEDGNKTESVGDCKETDKEPDLYLATSQQSQSPTPSNTFQETPDTAGAQPDQEEEEQQGHDKSKVQSDKDKGDVVEDKHEVECGRKEEKPGNESLSEDDEEEQKKDKVVA
ncbi:lymphocyte function-associated antigen 3 isoform X2 [Gymnodraco acuticeps]|uniref:Lymphocyte function-associated antigen 3 isoform X2 n=1 Tax=Gymnodraco acuticeps TaxID=8218 RepID=A0A6P8UVD5_GYMAC|nr:lymphocyte function-associated antigen 3 isoform X2 [Gymnodraco acuticeps]